MFEAFLEQDEPPDASIAILKRVDLLESDMQVEEVFEHLRGTFPPREQRRHLAVDLLGGTGLHVVDHVVEALVGADREPILAAVAGSAFQDFVEPLDVRFRQGGRGGRDDLVDGAEMVGGLDDIVHGHVRAQVPDGLRLENPARLFVRKAASLDVVGVVGEVDLKSVVESSGDSGSPFRLQNAKNGRGEGPARLSLRLDRVAGHSPLAPLQCRARDAAARTVGADLPGGYAPLCGGFIDGHEIHGFAPAWLLRKIVYPKRKFKSN